MSLCKSLYETETRSSRAIHRLQPFRAGCHAARQQTPPPIGAQEGGAASTRPLVPCRSLHVQLLTITWSNNTPPSPVDLLSNHMRVELDNLA